MAAPSGLNSPNSDQAVWIVIVKYLVAIEACQLTLNSGGGKRHCPQRSPRA